MREFGIHTLVRVSGMVKRGCAAGGLMGWSTEAMELPMGDCRGDVEVGKQGEDGGFLGEKKNGNVSGGGLAGGFEAEKKVEGDGGELVCEDGAENGVEDNVEVFARGSPGL